MKKEIINKTKLKVNRWWTSLIIGILALAIGIVCSFEPYLTVGILTLFFIAYFMITGIFEIIFSIANKEYKKHWGWTLVGGIVSLIFAIVLYSISVGSIYIFIYYIAFYILVQALLGVWGSFTLKSMGSPKWSLFMTVAILGVILGCVLVLQPDFTANFISIVLGASLICYGLFRIFYAFRLRNMKNLFE